MSIRRLEQSKHSFLPVELRLDHFVQFGHNDHLILEIETMKHVSSTEAKQRFAAILDAAQHEPVAIRRQNREVAVVLSTREYERLRGLNVQEFESFCDSMAKRASERGLSAAALDELLSENQD